ncbi:MAG: alpha/beta hydrolase [Actinomycetota bacterium]|nr:alpha/beta hydrolase [Actinomycetota bacterium]
MPAVTHQTLELDGQPVFLRRAGDAAVPVLYLHGVPTSSFDWVEALALGGGIAPDLPGFGRSGKRGDLDYSLGGYAAFLERLLGLLGIERVRLCVHDWGAAGLVWAMDHPDRVERLAIVDAVPLLPGYRWHRAARVWRTPLLGEIAVGAMTRPVLRALLRRASGTGEPLPARLIDSAAAHLDQGTQRAILRLHRASPPEALRRAGERLGRIQAPGLVLWGSEDTFTPASFGARYADSLRHAKLEEVERAGHWPWVGRPEVLERLVGFLAG